MTKFGQLDPYAYYDDWGNRYIFLEDKDFLHFIRISDMKLLLSLRN